MSSATELDQLLRNAIIKAREAAPRAGDDLTRVASQMAGVVERVTNGALQVELRLLDRAIDDPLAYYQLILRKVGSASPPTDLAVFTVPPEGYPIRKWWSKRAWETRPDAPDEEIANLSQLEGSFKWMIESPDSRLVALIAFLQPDDFSNGSGAQKGKAPRARKDKSK